MNTHWSASTAMKLDDGLKTQKRKFESNVSDNLRQKRRRKVENHSDDEEEEDDEEGHEEEGNAMKSMIKSRLSDLMGGKDEHSKGKHNHIYFDDEITKRSCRRLISQIEEMNIKLGRLSYEYDLGDQMKIYVHLHSPGGSVFAALSVIDTIRRSQFPVVTIIEGGAASAATLISVFGHERWITENSYMLIHQLSAGCWGKMSEIDDQYADLKLVMDHIYKIYGDKTTMKMSEIRNVLKKDRWWNAEMCLKKGLVDEIIKY